MATINQLWVNLGRPLPELNAHKCLLVHQGNDEEALKIKFKRPSELVAASCLFTQNGAVTHFVSVPVGSGYSVEAQVASTEKVGGIQIMITPIKRGPTQFIYVNQLSKGPPLVMVHSNASVYEFMSEISKENNVPVDQMRLLYNSRRLEKNHLLSHYGIPDKSTVKLVLNIQGRGLLSGSNPADAEMSVGAGDLIKQSILRDPHAAIAWEGDSTAIFIRRRWSTILLTPSRSRTGITGIFSDIQSVREIDIERGVQNSGPVKSKGKGLAKELEFPTIKLDKSGRWPKFVAVYEMEKKSMGWGNAQFS
ncbi:uncharacterized protein RCO7_08465 [Rhynchosporium graminicola]|uniref:Ubiquitin-like domain-containing protein n=1 Tax=Rhynchosporium graminicola TaxID=2792576 RepID=A0A1E1L4S6_9HELO|nr:uncharacterized protein RCO7_08465 [Rhynchosporium commune]